MQRINRFNALFFLWLYAATQPAFLHAGTDNDWADVFGYSGLSGVANDMIVSGSSLFVGGNFKKAGNKLADYIAQWDGTEWLALGDGFNSAVNAVAVDGSGNIWAGGSFTEYGSGSSINHIAYWDGGAWNAVSSGVDGTVNAIAVDASGNVYVGGSFTTVDGSITVNNVAMWNGSSWEDLGTGSVGTNGVVHALAVDNSGNLYVGGNFNTAGGSGANYIAKWNGAWSSVGTGMNGIVYAIETEGTDVYAGGQFTTAGGTSAPNIAVWNTGTTTWSDIENSINTGQVNAIWYENSTLYVGGSFSAVGGSAVAANNIAQWTSGSSWQALGSGVNNTVNTITENVNVGGYFTSAGGQTTYRVAQWSGSAWSALSNSDHNGVNGTVYAIAAENPNSIYAGGLFSRAGSVSVSNIAKWDGSFWSDMDNGVNDQVEALAVYGSTLYAGGSFSSAGSGAIAASNLAKYESGAWSDVASGTNGTVSALAVDGSGNLYVGGSFTQVGGDLTVDYIAMYDGTWHDLGSNFDEPVQTICINGADIYVGGEFTISGGAPGDYIAVYSGSSWSDLDTGTNGPINDMDVSNGYLYVGGNFSQVGSGATAAFGVAKWNLSGSSWSTVGTNGVNNEVYAVVADGSDVYFGGVFTVADAVSVNRIVKWTGSAWEALGSGVGEASGSGTVWALEVGSLYVGGTFEDAGNKPSYNFGKYSGSSAATILIELTVILEGPYDSSGDDMAVSLNPYIPTTSPYDASVTASVPANAVDWIEVSLRTTLSGADVASASAFLHNDGSVTQPGQSSGQVYFDVSEGDYFILIEHRNHLDMISATAVTLSAGSPASYDFTDAVTKAHNSGQKSLGSKFGMYAGDGNADGDVQNDDKNDVWWPDLGKGGYFYSGF